MAVSKTYLTDFLRTYKFVNFVIFAAVQSVAILAKYSSILEKIDVVFLNQICERLL